MSFESKYFDTPPFLLITKQSPPMIFITRNTIIYNIMIYPAPPYSAQRINLEPAVTTRLVRHRHRRVES